MERLRDCDERRENDIVDGGGDYGSVERMNGRDWER